MGGALTESVGCPNQCPRECPCARPRGESGHGGMMRGGRKSTLQKPRKQIQERVSDQDLVLC